MNQHRGLLHFSSVSTKMVILGSESEIKEYRLLALLLPKIFPSGGGRVETLSRPPARQANNWSPHKLSSQYRVSEPIVWLLSALPLLVFNRLFLLQPISVGFYVTQWIETLMSVPLNQYL